MSRRELADPNIVPPSGDQGTDRMLAILASERPSGRPRC